MDKVDVNTTAKKKRGAKSKSEQERAEGEEGGREFSELLLEP